jgi:hypothetical protein
MSATYSSSTSDSASGSAGAAGAAGCRRHLKLLLEISNRLYPLLELKILLLDVVLEVYDRVRALIQHLVSGV